MAAAWDSSAPAMATEVKHEVARVGSARRCTTQEEDEDRDRGTTKRLRSEAIEAPSDTPGASSSQAAYEETPVARWPMQWRALERPRSGEWEEGDNFGADPLAKQSIFETMSMQIKACKVSCTHF